MQEADACHAAILSDNITASRAWLKGYSPARELDEIVKCGNALEQVVVLSDIPSSENIADILTRPAQEVSAEEIGQRARESEARGRGDSELARDGKRICVEKRGSYMCVEK